MTAKRRVIYEVEEIIGSCPVYKKGDKVVIDSEYPTEVINLKESDAVCMRIFDNAWSMPIWQWGNDRTLSYLAGAVGECRIACAMPGKPYTKCGYVMFRITTENQE